MTNREHFLLAVGCLVVFVTVVWLFNNFGGWME